MVGRSLLCPIGGGGGELQGSTRGIKNLLFGRSCEPKFIQKKKKVASMVLTLQEAMVTPNTT